VGQAAARWVGGYLAGHDAGLAARWDAGLAALPAPAPAPDPGLTSMGARLVAAMQGELAREEAAGRRLEASYEAAISALARAAEAHDRYTDEHHARVSSHAVAMGHALGLDRTAVDVVRQGARLHDVGKVGIPDAVLTKPGRLTDEETAQMRRHPAVGAEIVGRVPGLRASVPVVRHHHERWDGGGSPDGLVGEAVPLGARIVAVADSFDAMTTDRPYRRGMRRDEAMARIRAGRGSQFCPVCVDALDAVLTLEVPEADREAALSTACGEPGGDFTRP
jgi:HD-GYP domain-containing protein (c-di-GMP phosphodiesterase class II)